MNSPDEERWSDVRARLAAVDAAIEHGFSPSPEEEQELLRARARALAAQPEESVAPGELIAITEFVLAGEHYGFLLEHVRSVSVLTELTPVPCVPPFIVGIVNLRGQIRTVIDLRRFFELPAKGITDANMIILLENAGMQLAILADAVRGVHTIASAEMRPSRSAPVGRRADYVRGVTAAGVIVLDAARLLADKRIIVEEQVEV